LALQGGVRGDLNWGKNFRNNLMYLELSRNKLAIGYVAMILKNIHGIGIGKLSCQYGLLT